ncbi:hypothetical protein LCGC14_2152320 [marine sediment metagenome]|uniref:Uncharacterized protein n=1 Tax=marine sediment metagenome TaxID=412755 RepID=A0A0F9EHD3_9ZZZZ
MKAIVDFSIFGFGIYTAICMIVGIFLGLFIAGAFR